VEDASEEQQNENLHNPAHFSYLPGFLVLSGGDGTRCPPVWLSGKSVLAGCRENPDIERADLREDGLCLRETEGDFHG
jgi:hypothetical protein